jgi:ankyrin repeat protein
MECASVITADENLVKWHLRNGADPNIASWRGFTALEYATYNGSLGTVRALVEHGAILANTTALIGAASGQPREDRLAIMSFLLDHGVDIDQLEREQDPRGNPVCAGMAAGTALHHAVESGDPECLRFLLGKGADRRVKGLNGRTPLGLAEELGLEEMAGILRAE